MLENLDNIPISILVRNINGGRTTLTWPNPAVLVADLSYEEQDCIDPDEDEILLVMLGSSVLYSQLTSLDGITLEDIIGFFA